MTTEHLCVEFLRREEDGKFVYRCAQCKRDHTADDLRSVLRGITIRPEETEST